MKYTPNIYIQRIFPLVLAGNIQLLVLITILPKKKNFFSCELVNPSTRARYTREDLQRIGSLAGCIRMFLANPREHQKTLQTVVEVRVICCLKLKALFSSVWESSREVAQLPLLSKAAQLSQKQIAISRDF